VIVHLFALGLGQKENASISQGHEIERVESVSVSIAC
jgi:hypothetical protein